MHQTRIEKIARHSRRKSSSRIISTVGPGQGRARGEGRGAAGRVGGGRGVGGQLRAEHRLDDGRRSPAEDVHPHVQVSGHEQVRRVDRTADHQHDQRVEDAYFPRLEGVDAEMDAVLEVEPLEVVPDATQLHHRHLARYWLSQCKRAQMSWNSSLNQNKSICKRREIVEGGVFINEVDA